MLENDKPKIRTPKNPEEAFDLLISTEYSYNKVFRGQNRSSWDLESTLGRIHSIKDDFSGLHTAETKVYDHFVRRAHKLVSNPPDKKDVTSWMIIMQHYGAPTRLLDWTRSPFVALYFAYKEYRKDDEDVSIYILSETACKNANGLITTQDITGHSIWDNNTLEKLYSGKNENDQVINHVHSQQPFPFLLYPRRPDQRMTNQSGVLSVCTSAEANVPFPLIFQQQLLPSISTNTQRATFSTPPPPVNLLWKLDLPWIWREDVLNKLDRMGFNEATLFPNLEGLGRYSKWLIDGYIPISSARATFYNFTEE